MAGWSQDGLASGRRPAGRKKMRKSILALALALGVSSLTYTATAAPKDEKATTTKKHKKNKKAPKKTAGALK
jgi:hypothetical protein